MTGFQNNTKYFFDTKAMTVTELASDATTWIPAYFEGYIIFKPVLVKNFGLEGEPIESWTDYLNHDYYRKGAAKL